MTYILAFPTLVGAMTGYSANVRSFVPDRNNNLIQFNSFKRILYVIHGGWRISTTTNYLVVRDDKPGAEPTLELSIWGEPCLWNGRDSNWYLKNNVSNYAAEYGLYSELGDN
ncbi:hypothetical protein K505DRAFT_360697 [Melanomma pulvis-pyrius CBS 109.77]|uniref:Uncharacterized protein n=1 Tax=Melanomma pulvis-pyrius CBS 109.77 TaxID=1314802 RepID=A0A6A6XE54_9PLEO|nr:hypothetical protein K505DRAFT_360697 [Melanomma pulvis-pyrius CBS 109.77]